MAEIQQEINSLSKRLLSFPVLLMINKHRQSLEERDKEITAYKLQETSAINNHYQQTLTSLRERYLHLHRSYVLL